jgi:hypothetical protein
MTAWEILTAGSTLPNGTAWDHLNAQGGSGPVTLNIYGETVAELEAAMDAELESGELAAELETADLSAELQADIEAELE